MLILERKVDEVILIGDDIRIMVIKTGQNKVKLGIDAPKEINVVREELIEKKEN